MNILAINTAGERVELVLKTGDKVEYYSNETKEMASLVLLAEIDRLISKQKITLAQIDCFAVVIGPGSFTGIRIGVSTIRAFCQSLNKKAVAVNRLELMAYNNRNNNEYTVSIVDGQNEINYISVYSADAETEFLSPRACRASDLAGFLAQIEETFSIVSDNDLKISDFEVEIMRTTATTLIEFVDRQIALGKMLEYTMLEPLYIRKSQAERQAGEL